MHILTSAGPLVSLIAGILILVVPRLLNCIVAREVFTKRARRHASRLGLD